VTAHRTYGALLLSALDMEVFSYGTGGFGTLQELMVQAGDFAAGQILVHLI
jgi:hypothetical protein